MQPASDPIVERVREANVRLVRFLYCDNGGLIRGKAVHASTLERRLATGIGLTVAMQAFSSQDELAHVPSMGPVGEVRLIPDPDTLVIAPYAPSTAALLTDLYTTSARRWEACPRSFCRSQVERLAGHRHIQGKIRAAFEAEFTLAKQGEQGSFTPFDTSRCFASIGMQEAAFIIDDIVAALEAQGLAPEQYYPELGPGQHEISLHHAEGVRAADQHVYLRETVRAMAAQHGLTASFAPKPWNNVAGNGAHLHFSVWSADGSINLFANPTRPYGLSDLGRSFLAGVLSHLPALVAISCASVNSYRRLQPHTWSSAFTTWGPDNREAALRVASPLGNDVGASVNLELKASDHSGNPYLVLGAVIAAGIDGVERELQPPQETLTDPSELTEEQRRKQGVTRLPATLEEAVLALAADQLFKEQIPELLLEAYLAVKRQEIIHFAGRDIAYELARHFAIY